MKGLLKYKQVTIFMILVFIIGYIIFNYNCQSSLTKKYEKTDKRENSYNYNAIIYVSPQLENFSVEKDFSDDFFRFLKHINNSKSYVCIPDLTVLNNDSGVEFLADVCIGNNMPKYELLYGAYPTTEQPDKRKFVLLGRNKIKYSYKENGRRYIRINGEKYEVKGCLSTGKSYYLDNKVVIFDDDFEDLFWKNINKYLIMGCILISVESDTKDYLQMDVANIKNIIDKLESDIITSDILYDTDIRMNASHVSEPIYRLWAGIIHIFCIIITYALLYYMIVIRKKELNIKKICGFSKYRIIMSVLCEVSIAMIIAIFVGNAFIILTNGFAKGYYGLDLEMFLNIINILFFYYVSTMLVTAGYLSICLLKKNKRLVGT